MSQYFNSQCGQIGDWRFQEGIYLAPAVGTPQSLYLNTLTGTYTGYSLNGTPFPLGAGDGGSATITSNVLTLAGSVLSSTVNGVLSNTVTLPAGGNSIVSGSLTGNNIVLVPTTGASINVDVTTLVAKMNKTTGVNTGNKVLLSSGTAGVDNKESTTTQAWLESNHSTLNTTAGTIVDTNPDASTTISVANAAQLVAATVINPTDNFYLDVAGVNKKLTFVTLQTALTTSTITKVGTLTSGGATGATAVVVNAASMPLSLKDGDYYDIPATGWYNLSAIGYGAKVKLDLGAKVTFNATQSTYIVDNAGNTQVASEVPTIPLAASTTNIALVSTDQAGVNTELATAIASVSSLNVIVTSSSNYTALPNDYYIVVKKATGSASTVNLPANPVIGKTYIIKDGKGDANTNNITVSPAGGVTIDGLATKIINANFGICKVFYTGTEYFLIN